MQVTTLTSQTLESAIQNLKINYVFDCDYQVMECPKCCASGKFYYQDRTVGVCYTCNGDKYVCSNQAKTDFEQGKIKPNTRYVTGVAFENGLLILNYIAQIKDGSDIIGRSITYDTESATEYQKTALRAIYWKAKKY